MDELQIEIVEKNRARKNAFIIAIIIVAIALLTIVVLFMPKTAEARAIRENLDLGDKYLSELNYEQAIASYLAVIEIDPKNESALLGLADAYVAQGEFDKAEEVLENALEELDGDVAERIKEKQEEMRARKKAEEVTPTNTPTPEPTATPTPEPTPTPGVVVTTENNYTSYSLGNLELRELNMGNRTFVAANGGVIVFSQTVWNEEYGGDETLFGAMDYNGNVIVEAKNQYRTYPDDEGYFALAYSKGYDMETGEEFYVVNLYDKNGNVLLTEGVEQAVSSFSMLMPKNGVFAYMVKREGHNAYDWYSEDMYAVAAAYNAKQKKYVYKCTDPEALCEYELVGCNENYLAGTSYLAGLWQNEIADFSTGEVDMYYALDGDFEAGIEEYITVKSAPADGYWVVKVEKIHWSEETGEEMLDTYYGLVNVDGSVAYLLSMNALKEKFKDNEIIGIRSCTTGNGVITTGNVGTKMVLDGAVTDIIIDFSKTTSTECKTEKALAKNVYVVSDLDNVVVDAYDSITLASSGWSLIQKDGLWCYMDVNDNVVADFDDCAAFYSEYSVAIKDGKAYLINQKLERVFEICKGTGVACTGDRFTVQTADGDRYFVIIEK